MAKLSVAEWFALHAQRIDTDLSEAWPSHNSVSIYVVSPWLKAQLWAAGQWVYGIPKGLGVWTGEADHPVIEKIFSD